MEIQLTRGLFSVVDDNASPEITSKKWYAEHGNKENTKFYAAGYEKINGKKTKIYLHRVITKAKKGEFVDHINGDTLDNRSENLRICNASENQMNRCINSKSFSGVRGISFEEKSQKWTARIKVKGKSIWLGRFMTKEAAMFAYSNAARDYFGPFCPLEISEKEAIRSAEK